MLEDMLEGLIEGTVFLAFVALFTWSTITVGALVFTAVN